MAPVLVVVPSPKSQNRFVTVPVEISVKLTLNGLSPIVGFAVKLATGTMAPTPMTALVLRPPLVSKTTRLLKLPAEPGLKVTSTKPVCPAASTKPLSGTSKGAAVVIEPVSVLVLVLIN